MSIEPKEARIHIALQIFGIHHLDLEYLKMLKLKNSRSVLAVLIIFLAIGLISSSGIEGRALPSGHCFSNRFQETSFQVLIVDCQSTLYSRLCDFVSNLFTQEEVSHIITRRKYDSLKDIVESKLKGFDLLIISGSSTFFPDSTEVKDVAALLKISIDQNKYAYGICFGLQLLAYLLDSEEGKLIKSGSWDKDVSIHIIKNDSIFKNVGSKGDSFFTRQYHNYSVLFRGKENLGDGIVLAKSKDGIEIIRVGNVVASQFHPESRFASPEAKRILKNYLREVIQKYLDQRPSKGRGIICYSPWIVEFYGLLRLRHKRIFRGNIVGLPKHTV